MNILFQKTKYLSGHASLVISEGFYDLAFVAMAYRISGHAMTGAVAYALGYVAEIIVSFALGGFLDAYSKKRLFEWTMLLKMALFIFVIYYTQTTTLSAAAIWFFAFLADLLHHISRLVNTVSLFQMFEGKDKLQMQGLAIASTGLFRVLGPILAGAAIGIFGNPVHLLTLCLVLQAIAVGAFRTVLPQEPKQAVAQSFTSMLFSSVQALREALSMPAWRWFFYAYSLAALLIGTATLMLFPLLRQIHSVGESGAGFFMGMGAVGMVTIGLLFDRLLINRHPFFAANLGLWMTAVCMCALSAHLGHMILGICLMVFQSGSTLFFRSMGMHLQNEIPEEKLGSWGQLPMPLGGFLD